MMGLPSWSAMVPGGSLFPARAASENLLPAMVVVAASKSTGASLRAGAAMEMGLLPSLGSAAKVGSIPTPAVAVEHIPTMSSLAASMAK